VKLSKAATALALSMAFAATLAAAPQATKSAPAAKTQSDTKTATSAAAKAESVKPADLPKPVTDAVMKAHPKGSITAATKSMKGSDAWYKVTIKDGSKTSSMTLDATGNPAPAKSKGKSK
jgi:hypothetical protein